MFIMVQNPAYNIAGKLPKKGNLENVEACNQHLFSIVCDSRIMYNYIKAGQEESSSNIDLDQGPEIESLSVYKI